MLQKLMASFNFKSAFIVQKLQFVRKFISEVHSQPVIALYHIEGLSFFFFFLLLSTFVTLNPIQTASMMQVKRCGSISVGQCTSAPLDQGWRLFQVGECAGP